MQSAGLYKSGQRFFLNMVIDKNIGLFKERAQNGIYGFQAILMRVGLIGQQEEGKKSNGENGLRKA